MSLGRAETCEVLQVLEQVHRYRVTKCKGNKVVSYIDDLLGKAKNQELSVGEVKEILLECAGLEKSVGEEYHVKISSQLIRASLKAFSRSLQGLEGLRTILDGDRCGGKLS